MPPLGACAFERVSALLAIPDPASAKSVSPIATVRELEYGLSVSAPPVGAAESGVTVKPVAEEATAALFFAVTELAPAPVLEASQVTSMRSPAWEAEGQPVMWEYAAAAALGVI